MVHVPKFALIKMSEKKAIKGLIASEQATIEELTTDEWLVLHQDEVTLEMMVCSWRILEG